MLVKTVCPQCGGRMELDDSRGKVHCPYCGTEIVNLPQKVEITHRIDRTDSANVIVDFASADPSAVMIIAFEWTGVKRVMRNGQTAFVRLPSGRRKVSFNIAGRRYSREIWVADGAVVRINASHFRINHIVIDQPPHPKPVPAPAKVKKRSEPKRSAPISEKKAKEPSKGPGALSVVSLILVLAVLPAPVGTFLGARDIVVGPEKPHALSVISVVLGSIISSILLMFTVMIAAALMRS